MYNSRLSIAVFGLYLALIALVLLLLPEVFILLGFESMPQPWVAISGYLVAVLAYLYLMAMRSDNRAFYRWTVFARLPLLPFYLLLFIAGHVPVVMLVIGLLDLLGASWTARALRQEGETVAHCSNERLRGIFC